MNFHFMRYILGWILIIISMFMILPIIVAFIYHEDEWKYFLLTIAIVFTIGFLLRLKKPKSMVSYSKEGLVLVAIGWILISVFGAIPFFISKSIPSFVDAFFETVSGFSTTGASILNDVEALPKSMLFWRSFLHWIGGMGILVFVLAIIPLSGGYNMNIMKAESPGPQVGKLVPKIQATAKRLYIIYISITLLEMIILLISKMPVFDAVCISIGTAGTGGFGVRGDSCDSYTYFQQVVITVFMLMFGVNFNVYSLLLNKKFKDAFKCEELRHYGLVIIIAVVLIFSSVLGLYEKPLVALKDVFFTVAAIITTTGFSTADFDKWPEFAKGIIVVVMFFGACAGSTGGGIKISRCFIMMKTVIKEVHQLLYPKNIEKIRYEGKVVEHSVLRSINVFLMTYIMIFIISFLIISRDGYSFGSNFTAVTSAINNIGPGIQEVGPSCNFAHYSALSKIVLSFDMLAGRLELFPILMLFVPKTWKKF